MRQLLTRVISRFRAGYNSSYGAITSLLGREAKAKGAVVSVKTSGLNDASGVLGGFIEILVDGSLLNAQAAAIGDMAIVRLRESVEPISRTGTLRDSFRWRREGSGVVVYSESEYAQSLRDKSSMDSPPTVQGLLDWMQTKPDFAGLDEKAAKRVAFAIRTSIATGAGRGSTGRSDLSRLSPSGQRAYDYVEVAARQLEGDIQAIGLSILGEATNVA